MDDPTDGSSSVCSASPPLRNLRCGPVLEAVREKKKGRKKVIVTHPGKFGDILWALPTVRALAQTCMTVLGPRRRSPIDFVTSKEHGSICNLVESQPYIRTAWSEEWPVSGAPLQPASCPFVNGSPNDQVLNLGYLQWPTKSLPFYTAAFNGVDRSELHLERPWIEVPPMDDDGCSISVGFSEEHIELKMGILLSLASRFPEFHFDVLVPPVRVRHYEWVGLTLNRCHIIPCGWTDAARIIKSSTVFLGCLSALWVLANAVGTPTVIVEPNELRHDPIFWVENGRRNHLVRGNDGKPTFDARHVSDMLTGVIDKKGLIDRG